jgi:signal transduction histidine kinase
MIAALPLNEPDRLRALRDYDILDTLPEQEYQDIVQLAALICDTPIALVSLVDSDRQWFKAKVGLDADETPRESAFCAHALLQPDQLFIVADATQDPRFADNPMVTGAPSINFYAAAPLKTPEGHVLGTICVVDRRPRELDARQQQALFALSRQVMTQLGMRLKLVELEQAQARLREASAHQDRIKEEERRRIAREIHDELGGVMTGIKSYLSFTIDSAQRKGETLDPHLLDATMLADTAIDTVRRVITDLRPSVLDQLGVWSALEWYAGQFEQRTRLRCTVDIDPQTAEQAVGPECSTALFRIVQETLTNVARHANATHVHMQARAAGSAMVITIRDDGRGILAPELLKRDAWGIAGMHERVRYLGGALTISGSSGSGTLVTVEMPIGNQP